MAKCLFVTDLDYTLVGDDVALENLNRWLSEQGRTYGTVIFYATGRSLPLYQELIAEKELLEPDILVLAVGTEIYYQGSHTPDPDDFYTVLPQLEAILKSRGLAIQIVSCVDGVYLDILPHRANKGLAVLFLQQRLGFVFRIFKRQVVCQRQLKRIICE